MVLNMDFNEASFEATSMRDVLKKVVTTLNQEMDIDLEFDTARGPF